MYDFETLEKKCKNYHFRRYLLLSLVPLLLLIALGSFFVFQQKENFVGEKKSVVVKKSIKKESVVVKPKESRVQKDECYYLQFFTARQSTKRYLDRKERQLQKLGFHCYVDKGGSLLYLRCNWTKDYNQFLEAKALAKENRLDFLGRRVSCSQKPKSKIRSKNEIEPKKVVAVVPKEAEKVAPPQKQEEQFILQSQKVNLPYLKRLFQERKSYNIALKIARYYYNLQEFEDAIMWAKRANAIDKSDAESWIIYAKSLYTLGKKARAKKILHIYLQFENSEQVTNILSQWSNQ